MPRKKFNKEFKVAAVKLVLADELKVSQVAQRLSVHSNSLYRWVNEYEKHGESAFPGNGSTVQSGVHTPYRMKGSRSIENES